jgi:hypothetical protein
MLRVLQTLTVHLFFIIFFAIFYYYSSTHFDSHSIQSNLKQSSNYNPKSNFEEIVDFFLFSTTIQAGVGISDMLPNSIYGKLLMTLQQLIMISISVLTIYIFTK